MIRSQDKNRPPRLDLLQTGAFLLRRGLRSRRPWQRALETPALWVALFIAIGTWALMPGAFLFSQRAVPGTIAGRDYVVRDKDVLQIHFKA